MADARTRRRIAGAFPLTTALAAALLAGCAATPAARTAAFTQDEPGAGPVTIAERFTTPSMPAQELDSLALWRPPGGNPWLLATAKNGARVMVFDALTGAVLGSLQPPPQQPPLLRPNGIAVAGDAALVVDQQRARVDVLRLPDGARIASIGEGLLRNPYGIWARPLADGSLSVYVTDSYRLEGGRMPPAQQLGERVRQFRVWPGQDWRVRHLRSFGATSGPGMLLTVESIAGDPRHDRLLVAEEEPGAPSGLRVYRMDGTFTGTTIDSGVYQRQAEGLALVACADGSGYWIGSDQHATAQRFHVFDRASLRWLGAFGGERVRDTDGLAFAPGPLPGFPHGALYAQHDNRAVVAFDWRDIATALALPPGCPAATR